MKKQIFILVFLVVATFASVSKSYGQNAGAPTVVAPRPFAATFDVTNPMTPIAGKPYDYSAIINPAGGTTSWYATKATTFMTTGARVGGIEIPIGATTILAATNYITPFPAATTPSTTNITWSTDVLNGVTALVPLFVVVEYTGPAAGCANNNIKVMQILPKNAFTIDLTNMTNGGPVALPYGTPESQCYKNLVSSAWASATGITNNYGIQVLYFELVAANFSGAFKPTFKLTGIKGTQTAAIDWGWAIGAYPNSANAAAIASAAMPYTSPQQTVTTALTNTTGGAAIYIRVTITNNTYEGLSNDIITLAVDATDNSATPNPDVDTAGAAKAPFAETAFQTLNARPTVTPGTGMTFVTQVP